MSSISPWAYPDDPNEIYSMAFGFTEPLRQQLEIYQRDRGYDDTAMSDVIASAIVATNRPLYTREMLDNWSMEAWMNSSEPEGDDESAMLTNQIVRAIQQWAFQSITQMAPERIVKPHAYGYVVLTMDVGRVTLLSFPRYKYREVVDLVSSLTATGNMSIRGWKNVKMDRFAFVKSLSETMWHSPMR